MKFRLVEVIEKATPYMLRNDGVLLECGNIHPYIIRAHESIDVLLKDGIDLDALYWFYNNTNKETTRKNIQVVAKYFIDNFGIEDKYSISIYGNQDTKFDFGEMEEIYSAKNGEIEGFINIVSDDTNQEFCRVRTSNMLWGGKTNDIYFRISSVGFNWFPIIWNCVYKMRNQIYSVTICKDSTVFGGMFEPYKINGESLDRIPTEEFITLSGSPIIESIQSKLQAINYAREQLKKGKTVSESYSWVHPIQAHGFYKKQVEEQLDFDTRTILNKIKV